MAIILVCVCCKTDHRYKNTAIRSFCFYGGRDLPQPDTSVNSGKIGLYRLKSNMFNFKEIYMIHQQKSVATQLCNK